MAEQTGAWQGKYESLNDMMSHLKIKYSWGHACKKIFQHYIVHLKYDPAMISGYPSDALYKTIPLLREKSIEGQKHDLENEWFPQMTALRQTDYRTTIKNAKGEVPEQIDIVEKKVQEYENLLKRVRRELRTGELWVEFLYKIPKPRDIIYD
jgi:hypothetical protein